MVIFQNSLDTKQQLTVYSALDHSKKVIKSLWSNQFVSEPL